MQITPAEAESQTTSVAADGAAHSSETLSATQAEGKPQAVVPEKQAIQAGSSSSGTSSNTGSPAVRAVSLPKIHVPQVPALVSIGSNLPLGSVQSLQAMTVEAPIVPLPLPPTTPLPEALKKGSSSAVAPAATAHPALPIDKVQPTYPELARKMNLGGTVSLSVTVDTSGRVIEAKAISGPELLKVPAEQAVKQWKFRPATLNGQVVVGSGKVSIVFYPPKH
jgi:TonB family protein